MRDQGLGSWPTRRARMTPGKTALIQAGRSRTYAELAENTARLARGLPDRGITRGDRVVFLGLNSIELVETMFATAKLGGERDNLGEAMPDCPALRLDGVLPKQACAACPLWRRRATSSGRSVAIDG